MFKSGRKAANRSPQRKYVYINIYIYVYNIYILTTEIDNRPHECSG